MTQTKKPYPLCDRPTDTNFCLRVFSYHFYPHHGRERKGNGRGTEGKWRLVMEARHRLRMGHACTGLRPCENGSGTEGNRLVTVIW